MNYATKTEWTLDEAFERFNEDMSNSCDDGDRKQSTAWLAQRIGDAAKAETLRRDWMAQYRRALRDDEPTESQHERRLQRFEREEAMRERFYR